MAGNSFGKYFKLHTYGESHGKAIGGIIDGCPAGLPVNEEFIQAELNRRRPGQSKITSPRDEKDQIELLSGIFEGKTLGTPIAFEIRNADQHSNDYNNLKDIYRPSHADYTYQKKYGIKDHRGGGRSSARETIARVAAGAIAKQFLSQLGITINAFTSAVGHLSIARSYKELDLSLTDTNIVRCPDSETAAHMISLIEQVKNEGDTIGGVISCVATGVPPGWGEPVFSKLHADLGAAMLGINAVKGFEIGSGFAAAAMRGSEHNDVFVQSDNRIATQTNNSGGIQGGISNGEDIYFRVAFKPIATLLRPQHTVDKNGNNIIINPKGRHDPCVVPRAVPIVEAMTALVLADFALAARLNRL